MARLADSDLSLHERNEPILVLASASPRRRELVALLGIPFEVIPSRYEEPGAPVEAVDVDRHVTELAGHKAMEVAGRVAPGRIVLGADTEVSLEEGSLGIPIGKPESREAAFEMLRSMAGRAHLVTTGVALVLVDEAGMSAPITATARTRVFFRELTDSMIASYVDTDEPYDKAGGYGAQGYAAPFIERFEGDYFNVVGLPLCTVGRLLESAGILWWNSRTRMPYVIG
jgi:septum formation protein